jgi:hypothetical protein
VEGLEREDLQEEEIEGALDEIARFAHIGALRDGPGRV